MFFPYPVPKFLRLFSARKITKIVATRLALGLYLLCKRLQCRRPVAAPRHGSGPCCWRRAAFNNLAWDACIYATKSRGCRPGFGTGAELACETGRFGSRFGPFRKPKRAVLQSKTARRATRWLPMRCAGRHGLAPVNVFNLTGQWPARSLPGGPLADSSLWRRLLPGRQHCPPCLRAAWLCRLHIFHIACGRWGAEPVAGSARRGRLLFFRAFPLPV